MTRHSGILLHPTSLPGSFGIGEIGPDAHRWLDELAAMGQSLWQILPLGPTSYGDSPYQCLSTFAGNPLLISFDDLKAEGLLTGGDLAAFPPHDPHRIDFGAIIPARYAILGVACDTFRNQSAHDRKLADTFAAFCEKESAWLDDFAHYLAIKKDNAGQPWFEWPRSIASREPKALAKALAGLTTEVENAKIIQFLFFRQWDKLRSRAKDLGIQIIGDIPIFVAHDSADVWVRPDLFRLDPDGRPPVIAGVPPDYFNADGQRWGNPLYNWDAHAREGYAWWISRLQKTLECVDQVRIDHFRGFAGYWEVPASDDTAINGSWKPGPGAALFKAIHSKLGDLPIIAEDLGEITPDVFELRDQFHLPGMRVLQFAFGTDSLADIYVPENYPVNSVAYTGTHDNDTTVGYFRSEAGEGSTRTAEQIASERRVVLDYLGTDGSEIHWDFISKVWKSDASTAICPLQDVLGLDTSARMNMPGVSGGNWAWRFTWDQIKPETRGRLRQLTAEAGRLAHG